MVPGAKVQMETAFPACLSLCTLSLPLFVSDLRHMPANPLVQMFRSLKKTFSSSQQPVPHCMEHMASLDTPLERGPRELGWASPKNADW